MDRKEISQSNEKVGSRVLIGATAAYALLAFGGLAVVGTLPAASDTGEQLVVWFREHGEHVRLFVWMLTLTIPVVSVMVALLRRMLPAPYGDVFAVGAISFLVATAVMTWTWGGLALHADGLNPTLARTVLDVAVFYGPVLTGSTTTMMGPATLLGLRSQAGIPRWLTFLGVVAFVEQAIETITIFGSTGFTQPGGAMNMQLGGTLTVGWLVAFGLWGGLRGRAMKPADLR
jgi:hypothetical protein